MNDFLKTWIHINPNHHVYNSTVGIWTHYMNST